MKTIETAYAPGNDITFIMEHTYQGDDGDIIKTECVGWYYGEPNDDATKTFYGSVIVNPEWK